MRIKVLAFAVSLLLISNASLGIPQTPTTVTSSAQGATLLAQSVSALTGLIAVNDVTLTGTAEWIAGSDDEIGTATYKAVPSASRLNLTLSGGARSEYRSGGASIPTGTWIGIDGVSHNIVLHNLQTDAGWFPLFAISHLSSSANTVISYLGQETRNNSSVIHLSASQQPLSAKCSPLMQHLTQVDIYLDANTLLPVSYVFNIHPDNDAGLDIPTEIRYSNYKNVGGEWIPFHVQRFINNALALDMNFQNAVLNTGVTPASLSAQQIEQRRPRS